MDLTYNMSKLPKDILKKISEAEFLEKWNGTEWEKVPIDSKDPEVLRIREILIAEIEINVVMEAMELGLITKTDKQWD